MGKLLNCPTCHGLIDVPSNSTLEAMKLQLLRQPKQHTSRRNTLLAFAGIFTSLGLLPILWNLQHPFAESPSNAQAKQKGANEIPEVIAVPVVGEVVGSYIAKCPISETSLVINADGTARYSFDSRVISYKDAEDARKNLSRKIGKMSFVSTGTWKREDGKISFAGVANVVRAFEEGSNSTTSSQFLINFSLQPDGDLVVIPDAQHPNAVRLKKNLVPTTLRALTGRIQALVQTYVGQTEMRLSIQITAMPPATLLMVLICPDL